MRVWNKNWRDVVLLHFTDEWKENFRLTKPSFDNNNSSFHVSFVSTPISTSLHMPSTFQFRFSIWSSVHVLDRIRRGINTPFHPIDISLGSIKAFTWRLFSAIEPSVSLLTAYLVACKRSQWKFLIQFKLNWDERLDYWIYLDIDASALKHPCIRNWWVAEWL